MSRRQRESQTMVGKPSSLLRCDMVHGSSHFSNHSTAWDPIPPHRIAMRRRCISERCSRCGLRFLLYGVQIAIQCAERLLNNNLRDWWFFDDICKPWVWKTIKMAFRCAAVICSVKTLIMGPTRFRSCMQNQPCSVDRMDEIKTMVKKMKGRK